MRWTIMALTTLVFSLSIIIAPVCADDTPPAESSEQQSRHRNECLLAASKCGTTVLSIQDKVEILKEEIAKGKTVYTLEELEKLNQKLDEANKTLDFLLDK